jgi:hypothetical protein
MIRSRARPDRTWTPRSMGDGGGLAFLMKRMYANQSSVLLQVMSDRVNASRTPPASPAASIASA